MDIDDRASSAGTVARSGSLGHQALKCPCCGESLRRMRLHAGDRLLNLVWPGQRFCCYNLTCQWQGRRRVRDVRACRQRAKSFLATPSVIGP